MRDHRPRSTLHLLESDPNNIAQRAVELAKLNKLILALLPGETSKACRVANYRDGVLVVEAGSAAWAMRLNYERQHLLSVLRQKGLASLTTIEVKINPALAAADREDKETAPSRHLSQASGELLRALGDNASPKLKARFEALAKLAEDQKKPE
ncbi:MULTISPECIES: DUF721 domain-containing protein [Salinivibrio]|uniref:DUF721 domain-containing protein n=1 Tax=Salinivibrio siamensis TaxID=414286 RepID=A0ABX3KFR6_9GAMM|nr:MULTISPECIES: DciA family protein [Salinivibrio]KKA45318.1 hypothetical protein WN56_04985 [Salinivibrio sp. KP-1]MPS32352.1 DUF721 domain-containing protein [Salinivibrio sp. VYel7]MPX90098.1 DUF721 domain-containing protein [Salinivibrio sp. VYel1]MPX93745.1 DUF721 domain-containing protein [Salinivibrio sp. VYel9]MPX96576.1 DUF721 domain-containing protein [Salinivibrio sp. VYel6]